MTNEKTVTVTDIGTCSVFTVGVNGQITIIDSGGVPVADILDREKISGEMHADVLAQAVIDRWQHMYDGDAAENGLCVNVDGEFIYAEVAR